MVLDKIKQENDIKALSKEELPVLAEEIGDSARAFLKAVYRTGGELAVRGYATKEFLDKVMPGNSAVVTGCPSFYQQIGRAHV